MRTAARISGFAGAILAWGCSTAGEPIPGIEEPSGITRAGDHLYIVGDEEPGTYYSYPIAPDHSGRHPIDPALLVRHQLAAGVYAMDLEAINTLADGRRVILSERLSALFDEDGFVTIYPDFSEFGGRGFEGLAVDHLPDGSSRIALVWEGGYPDADRLPPSVRDKVCFQAMLPIVIVHDLEPGASNLTVRRRHLDHVFELKPPLPPGWEPEAQRFRCPDLVWHDLGEEGRGFIALISSGYAVKPESGSVAECSKTTAKGKPRRWCHKWLQRFSLDGERVGEPFDLDDTFPEIINDVNWEGMDWFDPGESLVFVYDEKLAKRRIDPQELFVMPLPEGW